MTTWYVRPDSSHGGTNAGASYANAWQGWSSIVWGGAGVVGGDTLYVCGPHAYGANASIGAHGASSEATRVTIRGDYPGDAGSITFTGSFFVSSARAYTTITELEIVAGTSNCIFHQAGGTNCTFSNCVFRTTDSIAISLSGSNGQNHSNTTISGCEFYGTSSNTGSGAAIGWFVSATSAVSTMTNLTIRNNTFQFDAGRSVIHLRTEDDTDSSSIMSGIVVNGNTFTDCTGVLVEANHGHATANIGGSFRAYDNVARNCAESLGSAGTGGFFYLRGANSGAVYNNEAHDIEGAIGFVNVFYGTYQIYRNLVDGVSTTTIDGNGILFDIGATNCEAWNNRVYNARGKVGAANSGVGIMLLAATGCVAQGNIVQGCKWGMHIGDQGGGQSGYLVGNTIKDCTDGAVYAVSTADLANVQVKNNVFTGDGYTVYDLTAVSWSAEDYNDFYGFATGASNHTLGSNSITSDPLLDSSDRPRNGSPLLGAGVRISGIVQKDFYGKTIDDTPDIGAIQAYAARTAATRTASTARTASTTRSTLLNGRAIPA